MKRHLPWLLPALLALALYLGTWCPFPTWAHFGEDGPELEAAGRTLGIPHPTGYPLLMLLVRVTGLLLPPPWSALNLITLLAAVAAVAGTAASGRALARRTWPAGPGPAIAGLASGIALATALTFWKQAVIGEVYTLHLALLACALALLTPAAGPHPRQALLACYILGLGLAHHLQILPAAAVIGLWLALDGRVWRALPRHPGLVFGALLCCLLPISLYAVHWVRSAAHPIFDWGDPETWPRLWWSMSGAPYRGHLLGGGLAATLGRGRDALLHGPVVQLGILGAGLAFLGLARALAAPRAGALPLLLVLSASAVAAAYNIPDPAAYYLPAVLGLALAAGLGAAWLARVAWGASARMAAPLALVPRAAFLAILVAALALQVARVRPAADARRELAGLEYAALGTAALAPHALVITHGDGRTFSLWYGTTVLRPRPDVMVVYDHLLEWPWYQELVRRRDPTLRLPSPAAGREMLRAVLIVDQLDRRPVYLTELEAEIAHLFSVEPAGPLWRVTRGPDLDSLAVAEHAPHAVRSAGAGRSPHAD
jgi:hypothetical protein